MFKLTRAAARQIRDSARNGDAEELALRIQASRKADGAIEYRMGFDEVGVHDVLLSCQGVDVVFAGSQKELLTGSVLDYVEYEPGEHRFVFLNPNDPHFRQPSED
jgi:iron-sulfur cluster assembly protein